MKTSIRFRILGVSLLLVLAMTSCNGNSRNTTPDSALTTEIYTPEYAGGFRILGDSAHESVIIESINPWQGADSTVRRLFIERGGEKAPEKFDGQVINGNARRIVTMSSTQIAMLDAIGEDNRVYGVSGIDYIYNPDIQSRRDSIADVGFEGAVDYERLIGANPDLVMLYGVNGPNPMEGKLRELGIPYIYIGDYLEESPIGKAEWVVALAEITGQRKKGESVFAEIPQKYNALKSLIDSTATKVPSVMLNIPYGDAWFMPSTDNYTVRLIVDAKGDYIYKHNSGNSSRPIDLEEAYMLTSSADMWINTGTATTLAHIKAACPKFTDTRCYRNAHVYNNNLRTTKAGGNDYYESGIMHPDLILRDLITIFHPGTFPVDSLVYYRRLE
ncbi:ABC transporter substrate-binding protein [Muribaculum sp.]|uniref:ABC transporter substrate-binding protein n=1 Tax=Muribaculum sp. TaxID=1918611 RepID=UPI0023BD47C7|nr:ABC transporter substrate-binding protein [Muribaculum sp.]MDE5705828.1 ABC transporter substrate-binding protein [Muribaculum sp.]